MFISLLCWICVFICKACADMLLHKWPSSIFSAIKDPKWFYYFHFDYNETWKRAYIDEDPTKGLKRWLGIFPILPAFLDGWHGLDLARTVFGFLALVFIPAWGNWNLTYVILFVSMPYVIQKIFYGKLLLKSFWEGSNVEPYI